jgi:signal transduction histidine kinase/ligand-binding sensor domain-containing protein
MCYDIKFLKHFAIIKHSNIMKIKLQITTIGLVLFFVMLIGQTFGQQIVFNKLIPPDGNSFPWVVDIAQDINGEMWFSTHNGVYSYDGIQITTFKNNPLIPNTLVNNAALSICTDNSGMIWIGTLGHGLDMFNPEAGNFTHFKNDPNDSTTLANDTIIVVLIDKEGTLWIGTHGGLDKYNPATNTFKHYQYEAKDSTSLSNNQVRAIYEDRKGTLWIGTGSPWPHDGGGPNDGGLNKMNKEAGTFTRYLHNPNNPNSLFNNKVSAIFEDNVGTFWIGTWKYGIQKMNQDQESFEQVLTESELSANKDQATLSNNGLTDDYISFITQDATGKIWFGTFMSGLYCYNPENKKTIYFNGTENSSSGFLDRGARTAFNSRDSILWIGSVENIYSIDPSIKQIKHTSVSGSSVSSFYEEQNGDFWIGTRNEILRIIKNSGVTKRYTTDDYIFDAPNNLGFMVYGDREGNVWVGTTESLNRFDKKTEIFIPYKHDPENNNSITDSYAITVYEDSKSNFWIGTQNGLNLMDRKTGHFTRFYAHPESSDAVGQNIITSITEDNSGYLWIGNYNGMGVNRFNPDNKEFKSYLKNTTIIKLYMDTDGVLWVGATNGLYKYNPDIDNFIQFISNGSVTNISEVRSMVEDNQKNLWLTTSNQIVRINPERDEISFFGQNYGISQKTFNWLSGIKRSTGEIYFGDQTGYYSFFPNEFLENLKAPEIIFTGFQLSDKKLIPGDGGPLKESLNEQKEIHLAYNQNVFSIDLAIVDYANPAQNRLTYYLENYDVGWRSTNSERRAYYFNVPPGKYTFRLKGVNSYGAWAEKTIDIIIKPPWWRTWLAYVIYALLFVAAVFGIDRFQRTRLLKAEKDRNRERELAQAKEIEKAYLELGKAHETLKSTQAQLIQSEKMASLGELTAGIAHEIQNPLNFVNNFSEISNELVEEIKGERLKDKARLNDEVGQGERDEALEDEILNDISQNLEKINHHGKRAADIVKGMLQHSRTSSGVKEPTDINALADEYLRLSYHGLRAKDKSLPDSQAGFNAEFKTNFDETLPKINVIPQDIGRVLLNLINNAFYAVNEKSKMVVAETHGRASQQTPPPFKPTVTVSTKNLSDRIEISIEDNGPGIPEEIKDKILQPFFTTKKGTEGTGLGLSITNDIVKAHGGKLNISSSPGGTIFKILLNK